jgi:hypothetical protein
MHKKSPLKYRSGHCDELHHRRTGLCFCAVATRLRSSAVAQASKINDDSASTRFVDPSGNGMVPSTIKGATLAIGD